MNNVGLAAHRFKRPALPALPYLPLARRTEILTVGPEGLSCLDNGSAYRSTVHAIACRALGIRHLRTRPYRPQTNGKAERFIRTLLDGWAYGRIYGSSAEREAALGGWLDFYNHHRPHGALGRQPPITRLSGNNLLRSYS